MESFRLPFQISGLYAGCAKLNGMVIGTTEQLVLEYRITDTFFGAWNGNLATWRVAWTDLDSAEWGYGFFAPWLRLSARTMTAFDKLPSAAPGQLRLRIPWSQRRRLRMAVSEINLLLSYQDADRYRARLPNGTL